MTPGLKRIWATVGRYIAHDDPAAAMANLVAAVVVWNQPFYPLYIWWAVGHPIWPSFFTFLSTPFFAAVPAAARIRSSFGRGLLCAAGIANTALTAKVFGAASGVEIFLIPCALLAIVLFRPAEWLWSLALVAFAAAVYFLLHDRYGAAVFTYSPEQYASLVGMNMLTVATLTLFVGLLVRGRLAELEKV